MSSALLLSQAPEGPSRLLNELTEQGVSVACVLKEPKDLVRHAVQYAPDVVVLDVPEPGDALFRVTQALAVAAPVPVLLLTLPGDVQHMARAVESDIHACAIGGCVPHSLQGWIELAQARWRHEQSLRQTVDELTSRLEERKAVERAKGILMQARQVSDEEAFQILRTVSMHANQRLGKVSEQIIHSSRFAEAVNRAGQLRMLSQRMVKLYLLALAGVQPESTLERLAESVQRAQANLNWLSKKFSPPVTAEMLQSVLSDWAQLCEILGHPPHADRALEVDALAERMLNEAERLTDGLKTLGSVSTLQVLNIAGRQRMLSQRFAKYALLSMLGATEMVPGSSPLQDAAREAFEQGLAFLQTAPLSTPDIRETLDQADIAWRQMLGGASRARSADRASLRDRLDRMAQASENLLDVFERLSDRYGHSLDMLLG